MKIVTSSNKSKKLVISKSEWITIGQKAGFTQSQDPTAPDFMAEAIKGKRIPIPAKAKGAMNKALTSMGSFHVSFPLTEIFQIIEDNGAIPLQEDNTRWSGFFSVGSAECGSDEARKQMVTIPLAVKIADPTYTSGFKYAISGNALVMTWCIMPSGKVEVVAYVS